MSLLDAIAFHYLMPFPLIVTCFIIVPSPFMHVVPTFHYHLFCHYYTYLLSPIAPLLTQYICQSHLPLSHNSSLLCHSCCVCFEFMFTWYLPFAHFCRFGNMLLNFNFKPPLSTNKFSIYLFYFSVS